MTVPARHAGSVLGATGHHRDAGAGRAGLDELQPAFVRDAADRSHGDAPRGGGTVVVGHQLWLDGFLPLGVGAADPANLDPPASDRLCDQRCCDAVLHRRALGGHVACSFCHRPCL